jgi:hypothetical protein
METALDAYQRSGKVTRPERRKEIKVAIAHLKAERAKIIE